MFAPCVTRPFLFPFSLFCFIEVCSLLFSRFLSSLRHLYFMAKTLTSTVGQISIDVRDMKRAVVIYKEIVGLPFLFEVPGMAFFQCGETRLLLALAEGDEGKNLGTLQLWIGFLRDSENNLFALMEERSVGKEN